MFQPRIVSNFLAVLSISTVALAQAQQQPQAQQQDDRATTLTIYSTAVPGALPPELYLPGGQLQHVIQQIPGYAIVKQEQTIRLDEGRGVIRYRDVASQIDPTTVRFESVTDPEGTRVLEQNYEFDLVSTEKLMERFLDKLITVEQARGEGVEAFTGKLLSTAGGIVLQNEEGRVIVVNGYSNARFPELPGGLITRPTLVWDLVSQKGGDQRVRVSYETKAMTWWADYNIVFEEGKDANSALLDLGAWVSIINQSGAGYDDAKLKLIAGDVHRAPVPQPMVAMRQRKGMEMAAIAEDAMGFQEKSFFEYHLYTLGRPTTLPQNSTKQIELFPAALEVPAEKVLVYFGLPMVYPVYGAPMTDRGFGVESNKDVDIYLRFKNEEKAGMGMPLPSGRIRVSKLDPADQSLEFIGEDKIDHTPKDEEVLIKLGSAFDVVGERVQTDFQLDTTRKIMEESFRIQIRNHKDQTVKVIVKELLYRWATWKITKSSHEYSKENVRTVHFPVTVDKDGEATIEYTVRYTW